MPPVRIESLRWAVGILLGTLGAMMIITPHHFSSPIYGALRPFIAFLGIAFILSGIGLVTIQSMRQRRSIVVVTHLFAAIEMSVLAYSFVPVASWTGVMTFGVLALGTAIAPFLPRPPGQLPSNCGIDLLMFVVGLGAAVTGLSILALPGLYTGPVFGALLAPLFAFAIPFLVGGTALVCVQIWTYLPRQVHCAAHLLAGGSLLWYCVGAVVPLNAWTGIAYYGGLGTLVLTWPWLESRLRRVEATSLQTRLALAEGVAICLSVVIVVFLVDVIFATRPVTEPVDLRAWNDLSFVLLAASVLMAALAGIVVARRLGAPLKALASVADKLAAGDVTAPLPQSDVAEIARSGYRATHHPPSQWSGVGGGGDRARGRVLLHLGRVSPNLSQACGRLK